MGVSVCSQERPLGLFEVLARNRQSALELLGRTRRSREQPPRVFTIPPRQRLPFTRWLVLRRRRATRSRIIIIIIIIIINNIIIIVITYCYGDRVSLMLILLWHLGASRGKKHKGKRNGKKEEFRAESIRRGLEPRSQRFSS